ncbi:endonuclease/exonuclease/phosphatase family protein [Marinihelvus fidelis]|uniref:Endonuclease/exonuclease/phosphatase family protein n=1 Tax=Marinihelvus fidelis TaxID=2613842 RepID=A0A5N0TAM5_9GAMM|nr:endonuclease/exonuclease/phosphatase family protein [Marinihelvus fidelis]KAA9131990.1 endonuclease/exonuclease/phosphatase family protein [Marinihelvus fidelis]
MAKLYSFASWNVEHFSGEPGRVARVVDLLKEVNPDVFALYEVKSGSVFGALMDGMPTHSFSITENTTNPLATETLVGVRRSIQHFVTQREEFKAKMPSLRPGALATLRKNGVDTCFLFLHVKSFDYPLAWGLRDDMFKHAASLKRTLDKLSGDGENGRLLVLGDLNTMGLSAAYNDVSDIDGAQELAFLEKRFRAVDMRLLSKTHPDSWWNGRDNWAPSSLDHVFASEELSFKTFDGADIRVHGWPEKNTLTQKRAWIDNFSDHALLYGEIHT